LKGNPSLVWVVQAKKRVKLVFAQEIAAKRDSLWVSSSSCQPNLEGISLLVSLKREGGVTSDEEVRNPSHHPGAAHNRVNTK
jgi:hypothetical protein